MGIKVHVIFYSMYGHVYRMAEAVVAGVKEVAGAEPTLFSGFRARSGYAPGKIGGQSGASGICARSCGHHGLTCGAAGHNFWNADQVREHVRADEILTRSNWRAMG
jgi:multimeric flavodoxin WrbA